MDERAQRALAIATLSPLTKKGGVWLVPSQSGKGRYTVCADTDAPHCTCPDHETRGVKCKHILAVEYVISRERHADGSTTVTETVTVQKTVKKTYPQNWTAYNAAQTHEKDRFLDLLRDLCSGVSEPEAPKLVAPAYPFRTRSLRLASRSTAPSPVAGS